MTLAAIAQLLQTALLLLTMAQGPNVPPALKTQAVTVANQAIAAATQALAAPPTAASTPATATIVPISKPSQTSVPMQILTPSIGFTRSIAIGDPSNSNSIWSTYSPFVMHETGWDRYRMYFGRNEDIDGHSADRIYLSENFGDGVTGWSTPFVVLQPGGAGENLLIHDPGVAVQMGAMPIWHLYYTGTDGIDSAGRWNNKIFHAVSSDGVNFEKRGSVNIAGLPGQTGTWGYGEPSVVYENGIFRLYFFSDYASGQGTVFAAESADGHRFTFKGKVSGDIVLNPEVRSRDGKYVLVANSGFEKIMYSVSDTPYSFPPLVELIAKGSIGWDVFHIGTPDLLWRENRLYYAGTADGQTGASALDNGQIGVVGADVGL